MNFLKGNNQDTIIFGHSPNNEIIFSDFKFITKSSYGRWFNGTNGEYYNGLQDKLTESDWTIYTIDYIALYFGSITVNGIYYDGAGEELFNGASYEDYVYRDDGYGLGVVSYIDPLNTILAQYQLRTRFYPASDNKIIGIINTAENFQVSVSEFAGGLDAQTDYIIKCEYGNVSDGIDGYFLSW